mgnify:FL=1
MKLNNKNIKVAIVMGSQSDYPVMKDCENILRKLGIKYETKIISAHRTPDRLFKFSKNVSKNNYAVIVAGAGGAAHLPGMIASLSILPVIGVPIDSKKLKGLDSLLSTVQMPRGVPVATVAIDGAMNAGILAASILATYDNKIKNRLESWKKSQTNSIKKKPK